MHCTQVATYHHAYEPPTSDTPIPAMTGLADGPWEQSVCIGVWQEVVTLMQTCCEHEARERGTESNNQQEMAK
jgi:hypothetical protein